MHLCRLLHHDADMACGMDFDLQSIEGVPKSVQQAEMVAHLPKWIPNRMRRLLSRWNWARKKWTSNPQVQEQFKQRSIPGFYDIWVGRDTGGQIIHKVGMSR